MRLRNNKIIGNHRCKWYVQTIYRKCLICNEYLEIKPKYTYKENPLCPHINCAICLADHWWKCDIRKYGDSDDCIYCSFYCDNY